MGFEKLENVHSDLNVNINVFYVKPKIFEAIDHLRDIIHKHSDLNPIFDFMTSKLLLILLRR